MSYKIKRHMFTSIISWCSPPQMRWVKSVVILGAANTTRTQSTIGMEAYRGCAHRLYVVPRQGVKHFNLGHSHPYTNKARTTYVILTRASTTSLTCAESPKHFTDDSKALKCVCTCGFDCRTLSWTSRTLPGEKYGAAQPDVKMLYPPLAQWQMIAQAALWNSRLSQE